MLCEEVESEWNHRVALYGMGGVGKTQVAIEYVYANRMNYDRIYWITAASEAPILSGFQEIAVRTQCLASISIIQNPDQKLVAKFVLSWLRQQPNWLIVLDNLDDITIVKDYLSDRGKDKHTLISTRNPNANGIPARGLEVPILETDESVEMLCKLSEMDRISHETSAIDVVNELQFLPLAIDQAASYVRTVTRNFEVYLTDYRHRRSDFHKWIGHRNRQYNHSLATVWLVSFGFVQQEMPVALQFLELLSFLNPDNISLEFLEEGKDSLEHDMKQILADRLMFAEILLSLEHFSLIKWSKERRSLSIHRLVQAVIQDKMGEEQMKIWASVVINMCDVVMPEELKDDTRVRIRQFQGQVVPALRGLRNNCSPEGADVVYRIGEFMDEEGKYTDAEKLISTAIKATSRGSFKDETKFLSFSSRLGGVQRKLGRLTEASELLSKVLTAQKATVGPENSETMRTMTGLAAVYRDQGLLTKASKLSMEALAAQVRFLGKEHPETLRTMNDLALDYWNQCLLTRAADLYMETLKGQAKLRGREHPETLRTMNNLALVYRDQGQLTKAADLHMETLDGQVKLLGREHPQTLVTMNNLAIVYCYQGQLQQAVEFCRKSLETRVKVLGNEHVSTMTSMTTAGLVYKA